MGDYKEQTDTHLAKDYNSYLIECIAGCAKGLYGLGISTDIDSLRAYHATIATLVTSTQFLFGNVKVENPFKDLNHVPDMFREVETIPLDKMSKYIVVQVDKAIRKMSKERGMRSMEVFYGIKDDLYSVHMLIFEGLQQRNMLVRTSSSTPKGIETASYWGTKRGMNHGLVENKLKGKNK